MGWMEMDFDSSTFYLYLTAYHNKLLVIVFCRHIHWFVSGGLYIGMCWCFIECIWYWVVCDGLCIHICFLSDFLMVPKSISWYYTDAYSVVGRVWVQHISVRWLKVTAMALLHYNSTVSSSITRKFSLYSIN